MYIGIVRVVRRGARVVVRVKFHSIPVHGGAVMSKKSRLSRDQKRKKKLNKRNSRPPESNALAYTGNRYKSKELVESVFQTEQGIYDTYLLSGRELTDDDVEDEIIELIHDLRARTAAELIAEATPGPGEPWEGSVGIFILQHWSRLQNSSGLPAREDLIGILRTILGSIDVWRSKSLSSRGYLNYLEGFMRKLGYSIRIESPDGDERPEEAPPDELYEIGQMWLAGSPEARQQFAAFANELLERGQSQKVVDVSQRLLGELGSPARPEFPILSELSIRAQKEQRAIASPQSAPGLKSFISRLSGW